MNLTEEQLSEIEEMAYRLIPPGLIAINIGVNEIEFIEQVKVHDTQVRKAFYKGYLRQQISIRDSIMKAAENGSNPAQLQMIKYFKDLQQYLNYE